MKSNKDKVRSVVFSQTDREFFTKLYYMLDTEIYYIKDENNRDITLDKIRQKIENLIIYCKMTDEEVYQLKLFIRDLTLLDNASIYGMEKLGQFLIKQLLKVSKKGNLKLLYSLLENYLRKNEEFVDFVFSGAVNYTYNEYYKDAEEKSIKVSKHVSDGEWDNLGRIVIKPSLTEKLGTFFYHTDKPEQYFSWHNLKLAASGKVLKERNTTEHARDERPKDCLKA